MPIQVSTRIDEATKEQFYKICDVIGITPSNALSIFIKSVVYSNGIPFPVAVPPEKTLKMPRKAMFGCMRGQFELEDDFDAPLEDFKDYME